MTKNQRTAIAESVIQKWLSMDKKEDKNLVIQPDLSDVISVEQLTGIVSEEKEYSYARFISDMDLKEIVK